MTLLQIAPPADEALTLDEAKAHLRVDGNDEDAYIASLIFAARQNVEACLQRVLISQTWEIVCDSFPAAFILPLGKTSSVVSIKYLDGNGAEQTVASTVYETDLDRTPGFVAPKNGQSWPTPGTFLNAVRLRYVVGYENRAAIPAAIKSAISLIVGGLYHTREDTITGASVAENRSVKALLFPYIVHTT